MSEFQKYYAVVNGRKPGIYLSWYEAEQQVSGFSNAIYQKFYNLKDAKEWYEYSQLHPRQVFENQKKNFQYVHQVTNPQKFNHHEYAAVHLYVNGCLRTHYKFKNCWSGAYLIYQPYTKKVIDTQVFYGMRGNQNNQNQTGEMIAINQALLNILAKKDEFDFNTVVVHYQYPGLYKWLAEFGSWTPKTIASQHYQDDMQKRIQQALQNQIKIIFEQDFHPQNKNVLPYLNQLANRYFNKPNVATFIKNNPHFPKY